MIRTGFESIGAPPAEHGGDGTPPLVPAHTSDTYLRPDQPFSNELAIRRVLRRLRGDVFWYEQHMDRKALEMLAEELAVDHIDGVRLMSGPANLTSRTKKAFGRFQAEFEAKGAACEWRVLTAQVARSMHARVIRDDEATYEVPPLSWILASGGVDSIRKSDMPMDAFEDAWSATAVPLSDWQTDA